MIKLKIDLDGKGKPMVVLFLDGEFQTIYGGDGHKEYRSVEDCVERAKEIQKLLPFQQIEITKEAVEKSSYFRGFKIL